MVVPVGIGAERGVVLLWAQRERRAARPSADYFRAEQRLFLTACRFGAEVLPVGGHPGVQLPEHQVGAVAPQYLRGRHRADTSGLIRIAEDELARFDRLLLRIGAGDTAAFHRRLADSVFEAEGSASSRELVAVLTPDHLDTGQLFVRSARPVEQGLQLSGVRR